MNASERYDSLITFYAEQYDLDPLLLKAQIRAESNFNPKAVSDCGAKGLSQFMDSTWAQWGKGIPTNPEEAIEAQCRYMKYLLKDQKEIEWALAAYNWGEGHVRKLRSAKRGSFYELISELPPETSRYVDRIMNFHQEYLAQ